MSLYYDAASILTAPSSTGGSFKSRIYNARNLKASPAQVFALIIETSKWDTFLKEVIEKADFLHLEPKLTPLLALLLVHDHLIAKKGIAAPAAHPLRQAIERHKTRLKAEFVKARVRRRCASIEELKAAVLREKGVDAVSEALYPRWVRINNVRTTLNEQLQSTFAGYRKVTTLSALAGDERKIYLDEHIPDLVAIPPGIDLTSTSAYKNGEIILQDKASCVPAYLLLGDADTKWDGDLIDGCAAPGNKTTHLASLLRSKSRVSKTKLPAVYSMDASPTRAKTLQKMVTLAGADKIVTVLQGQDFLALDPSESRFENVAGLLLDPSCSGSGIVGRDDVPKLALPEVKGGSTNPQGKKRKRGKQEPEPRPDSDSEQAPETEEEAPHQKIDVDRLIKLSNVQARIVEHALSFPSAERVTYSTCSIHVLENESVVSRILASDVAKSGGWRIMRRDEQPEGLKKWKHRGIRTDVVPVPNAADQRPEANSSVNLTDEEIEACVRCWAGDEEGTGGFFVAGFVRDRTRAESISGRQNGKRASDVSHSNGTATSDDTGSDDSEEEWGGFSD
ncbi:NOL1/NOP2/sun domain protein, putative [Paecilomyces variotii No. 5]|uniref:NOL1/NOP2/sun domain protein, putative n=1 Tax=Byssochlamys spectabilis (strain No. 5 / NBRC 109023) TaxID=1356009 RepID=V5G8I0_BYSSN|nr:NOL1/NOP2/sun domain protein, putative [Paecilomyces variotii No. 5]